MIWSRELYGIPTTPNYGALTGATVFDSTGLRFGVTNANGTVNGGTGETTSWKDIIGGSKNFSYVNAKGNINISLESNKRSYVISNTGAGLFRQASAAQSNSDFGFLWHHASGYSAMRWTIHAVIRSGCSDNYGSFFNLLGNNQGGANIPGILIFINDIPGSSDNRLSIQITKGSAGQINTTGDNGVVPSNTWGVLSIEFNGSLGATNSISVRWNGVLQTTTNNSSSTTTAATGTKALEIWGFGDSEYTMTTHKMSHLIIQNVVESAGVRNTMISELQAWADYWNKDVFYTGQTSKKVVEGRYYLGCKMMQDRVNDNILTFAFTNGTSANAEAAKRLSIVQSTNYGATWGSFSTVVDPAGNEFVQSGAIGVTDANKYVLIYTTHVYSAGVTVAPHKIYYTYSTNQGATWQTPVDITSSVVPSDGLAMLLIEGQVIVNNGRIMLSYYKTTGVGVTTNSANYLIYSDDDGATWSYKTIRTPGASYINEAAMLHVGGNNLYQLIGDYAGNDWRCYTSTNNGDTWTDQGLMDFQVGDTGPATLHKFKIDGVEIASFYYYEHGSEIYKVAYARVSDLMSSPTTAFPAALKLPIINQFILHGDFWHFNNSIDAVYCTPMQGDTFSSTVNGLGLGYVPTRTLLIIIQELGL